MCGTEGEIKKICKRKIDCHHHGCHHHDCHHHDDHRQVPSSGSDDRQRAARHLQENTHRAQSGAGKDFSNRLIGTIKRLSIHKRIGVTRKSVKKEQFN